MTRIRSGDIQVEGLRELAATLKSLDKDLARELRLANKSVATFVAKDAKSAAETLGGVAGHVAPSIKASAGLTSAGVAFGGSAYPMAAGAEFGSVRYGQFQSWRGNSSDAGYFVYPSIRRDADRIETEYGKALDDVLRKANLI